MQIELTDQEALCRLSWADLKSYLDQQGWHQSDRIGEKALVYVPDGTANATAEILVPTRDDLADYASRMADAVHTLARLEGRSALLVYQDLVTSGIDVVRVCACGASADGSIAIDEGVVLYREAENLMLAAACTVVDPRRSYHARKVTEATEYMKSVRFGQTERGSYVLSILSPVQPHIGGQQGLDLGEPPFARAVTLRLADALAAAKRAANRALAENAFAPFEEAVAIGVSANLCDAVARLAETGQGIDIGLTWARTRPAGRPRQQFSFSRDTAEVLQEAARIFRQSEPLTDTRIAGFVIALDRSVDQFDGNATLILLIGDKPRRVRVRFEQDAYRQVIRAFQEKLAISLLGDIFPVGQRWEIRNPRELRVLEDQDGDTQTGAVTETSPCG
jgi:hypothetical protein